jgi:hypothetical protein
VIVYLVLVAIVGLVGVAVFSDLPASRHTVEVPVQAP